MRLAKEGITIVRKALATQRYVEISREIRHAEVRVIERSFYLVLYREEIVVNDERLPISTVHDVSCYRKRQDSNEIGFLYLHTTQGTKTLYIREDPAEFIAAYLKLKGELRNE